MMQLNKISQPNKNEIEYKILFLKQTKFFFLKQTKFLMSQIYIFFGIFLSQKK